MTTEHNGTRGTATEHNEASVMTTDRYPDAAPDDGTMVDDAHRFLRSCPARRREVDTRGARSDVVRAISEALGESVRREGTSRARGRSFSTTLGHGLDSPFDEAHSP